MLASYERELEIVKLDAFTTQLVKDITILASAEDNSVNDIPALKNIISKESYVISSEADFDNIFLKIVKMIKRIIVSIIRLISRIFTTDAGRVDSIVKTNKRKISKAIHNMSSWSDYASKDISKGMTTITSNTMLFRLLSDARLNYFKRLQELEYINDTTEFINSYENVVTFMSKETIDSYQSFYNDIKSLSDISADDSNAPKDGELILPIAINDDKISFVIINLKPDGTGIKLIPPRGTDLVLNKIRFMNQLKNKNFVNDMMLDVTKTYEYITPSSGLITGDNISDEDIELTMEKIAFFYMRSVEGKKTQRAIAAYLAALSEGCSLSLRNYLRNLESVSTVISEIITYKER